MNKFIPLAICSILLLGTFMFIGFEDKSIIEKDNPLCYNSYDKLKIVPIYEDINQFVLIESTKLNYRNNNC